MKKILFVVLICMLLVFYKTKNSLPEEIIRFRVIPNSNNAKDIYIKEKVINNLNEELEYIHNSSNIEETRYRIKNSLKSINKKTEEILLNNNQELKYKIKYGINFFPEKQYNNVVYPQGEYESLVITLGEGKGENFWCIMYPSLCLLEKTESTKNKYKFFITKIIDKLKYN